jgi:hypothetical protein
VARRRDARVRRPHRPVAILSMPLEAGRAVTRAMPRRALGHPRGAPAIRVPGSGFGSGRVAFCRRAPASPGREQALSVTRRIHREPRRGGRDAARRESRSGRGALRHARAIRLPHGRLRLLSGADRAGCGARLGAHGRRDRVPRGAGRSRVRAGSRARASATSTRLPSACARRRRARARGRECVLDLTRLTNACSALPARRPPRLTRAIGRRRPGGSGRSCSGFPPR